MRLRETPLPIHAESLLPYSRPLKLGPNTLKRRVVLLAALSPFLEPYSSFHAQIAQRPTTDTSVEQCDENQGKRLVYYPFCS